MTFRRQTNRDRLLKIREEAARPQQKCACGKPATCYGTYEGITAYSCSDCCGHGNEDGQCVPMNPCPECGLVGEHADDCENAVDTELAPESGGDAA